MSLKKTHITTHSTGFWSHVSVQAHNIANFQPHHSVSWQWDLCEPSMKRDPRSLPFWCCLHFFWLSTVQFTPFATVLCFLHTISFIEKIWVSLPLSSDELISSDLHHTTQSCIVLASSAYIGDLYPAFFNSSVRLVSIWMVVISACSWPSQRSVFFRKFHPLQIIVNPRSGPRQVIMSY